MSGGQRLLVEDIEDDFAKPSTFESFKDFRLTDDVAATDVDENGTFCNKNIEKKLQNCLLRGAIQITRDTLGRGRGHKNFFAWTLSDHR